MRRGNNGGVRRNEEGDIVAVNLGSDFTAEHEWGIKGIQSQFGLDDNEPIGIDRVTMKQRPQGLYLDLKQGGIGFRQYAFLNEEEPAFSKHDLTELYPPYGDEEWESQGAWSEGDFGVVFRKTEQGAHDLADLWAAFERQDVAFMFSTSGRNNPFERAGLNLVIRSRLDRDIIADFNAKTADDDALKAAAEATGIKARLDAFTNRGTPQYTGHTGPGGFYALSPRWAEGLLTRITGKGREDVPKTAHPVIFWLNPAGQEKYDSGYFTVEELDAWLRGEGPVVKANQS